MQLTNLQNRKLKLYLIITFALTYGMGILMYFVYGKGTDVSAFPSTQMLYPAAAVIITLFLVEERERLTTRFFIGFLVITIISMVMCVCSLVLPNVAWALYSQYVLILGSLISWVLLLTQKRGQREACGLRGRNIKISVCIVLLFVGLYLLRTVIAYAVSGQLSLFEVIFSSSTTWIQIAVLPLNFFLVFAAFFGEEYGWRYFLQPLLQKRFGLRGGIIVLGLIWGIWHLPVNMFYYSPDTWVLSVLNQLITCITLGIFFAYAYMKTQNIWVPVILHYLNNNLVPVITGVYSSSVLQNQTLHVSDLLFALVVNGVLFGGFILCKQFRECKDETLEYPKLEQ